MKSDSYWMNIALEEAKLAFQKDEVPIGAILVKNDKLIAKDHNRVNEFKDPLAHAEKLVIEKMIQNGEKFLSEYTLYVTTEPCLMCAGMIIWTRVSRVVFGCYDPKAGSAGSIYNALLDNNFNHNPILKAGVMKIESAEMLKKFFLEKR